MIMSAGDRKTLPDALKDIGLALDHVALARAADLAWQGRLRSAKSVLESVGRPELAVARADLLARIAVLGGDYGQARQIWDSIVRMDPGELRSSLALKALATLQERTSRPGAGLAQKLRIWCASGWATGTGLSRETLTRLSERLRGTLSSVRDRNPSADARQQCRRIGSIWKAASSAIGGAAGRLFGRSSDGARASESPGALPDSATTSGEKGAVQSGAPARDTVDSARPDGPSKV